MCDASDYAVGDILGKRNDKKLHTIYYASNTLEETHINYATTEKIASSDKFRYYLVGSEIIVCMDYAPIR